MSNILFFTDLDDTLIQTKRKTIEDIPSIVGSLTKCGKPSSFLYHKNKELIDRLISSGIKVIPTTARNISSYKRTIFYKEYDFKYSILNFGGTIIDEDRSIDQGWNSFIKMKYNTIPPVYDVYDLVKNKFSKESKVDIVIKNIDDLYVSIYPVKRGTSNKENVKKEIKSMLEDILSIVGEYHYHIYENDESFGLLPNFLNRKYAVSYIIQKENPLLTLGAGDNLSDIDFMQETDFIVAPSKSRISNILKKQEIII